MRTAFPLRNKRELAIDFGHCDVIGIYDDISKRLEYLPIVEKRTTREIIQDVTDTGVDCVVSPYFSCNSLQAFNESNIKTYKARSEKLEDNVKWLFSKMLQLFNIFDTLHVDECAEECRGCLSNC